MRDTKLYALGIPTLFLLSGLLLLKQENSMREEMFPSSPPIMEESESSKQENSLDEEGFSIEVTEMDENFILHFLIHNHSQEELVYGMHYSLSKLEQDTWIPVDLDMAFVEIACILPGNSTAEETIYLDYLENQLSSGTYRLENIDSKKNEKYLQKELTSLSSSLRAVNSKLTWVLQLGCVK